VQRGKVVKVCYKCNCSKSLDLFIRQSKTVDGYASWCKSCFVIYRREKYLESRSIKIAARKSFHASRIKWLHELKSQPCLDCGGEFNPYLMDYDHVRGVKCGNVSKMAVNCSKIKVLEEISKCDLVCAMCHGKRTYDRLNVKFSPRRRSVIVSRNIGIIEKFKDCVCAHCGEKYASYNMQIDHLHDRESYVCDLKSSSLKILESELLKCQVLCIFCHRLKSLLS
jgi:hypothetical protein